MASSNDFSNDDLGNVSAEENLAQVWKDLQKGEKTAQVLESSLTSLEKKIDDLLAGFEESERRMMEQAGRALNGKSPAGDQERASDEKGGSGGQANP